MFHDCFRQMPIVAILRGIQPNDALAVGNVLLEGGITVMETPLNSPNPLRSIETLAKHFDTKMVVGAGTVLTPEDVDRVADAGGKFIVSPNTNESVIQQSKLRGLVSMPGCATPTEAIQAIHAGADLLKLFPGELVSPGAFRAIKAVLPDGFPTCVVGGVGASNMKAYLDAGASGFGIGASIFEPGKPLCDIVRDVARIVAAFHFATSQGA